MIALCCPDRTPLGKGSLTVKRRGLFSCRFPSKPATLWPVK